MKKFKIIFSFLVFATIFLFSQVEAEIIDVYIKGIDDGKKTTRQQDYKEAVLNAMLQAIERAGIEITSYTKVENFQTKYDLIETKAKAVPLPGFQITFYPHLNVIILNFYLCSSCLCGKFFLFFSVLSVSLW